MPPTSTPLHPTPTTNLTRTHNFNQFTDTLIFYSHHNTKLSQYEPSSKVASLENLPYLEPVKNSVNLKIESRKERR